MCKISNGFKIQSNTLPRFIDKLLKFEEMENFTHHVKLEMLPALYKFPILLSTVKFN